jgi:outer membrane protein
MKKITLFAIAMFATLGAFAQFNKGRMLVGGSSEFSTNKNKEKDGNTTTTNSTQTSFSLSPNFGYFVIDQLAVGASLGFGVDKWNDKSGGDFDNSTTSFQIAPFVRYYLPVGVFFQGRFGVGTQKTKFDNDNFGERKYNNSGLSLSAGYVIFLNDYVALEPELGYRTSKSKEKDSDEKDIDSGLFLRIGFQIYLGNK